MAGNNPTLYGYVEDTNGWIDPYGLLNWKGFSSTKIDGKTGLQRHYDKHVVSQNEFGDISQNEYLKKAKEFGNQQGGNIREEVVGNFTVKHNPDTGEVFIGHNKKREIRTYYIDDGRSGDAFEDAKKTAKEKGCH